MTFRFLKFDLKNKKHYLIILVALLAFILYYLSIKDEIFFYGANYINNYIDYYITNYLNGDASQLLYNNGVLLYVESEIANIYSALYIYVICMGSTIFKIMSIVLPIIIFHIVFKYIHDCIYKKAAIPRITRIGYKKFIHTNLFKVSMEAGIVMTLPKILFLIILLVLFPTGTSTIHYINNAGFLTDSILYNAYSINPYTLVFLDLLLSFLYGILISFISIIIISKTEKKGLSYIKFIIFFAVSSIVLMALNVPALLYFNSIYNYFSYFSVNIMEVNVFAPIIILTAFIIVSFIMAQFTFRKKVRYNL